MTSEELLRLKRRCIPLPQHIHVDPSRSVVLDRDHLSYLLGSNLAADPRGATLTAHLNRFARPAPDRSIQSSDRSDETFLITVAIDESERTPEHLQGYAIHPVEASGRYAGLSLVARTLEGLLNGTRTLSQLCGVPRVHDPYTRGEPAPTTTAGSSQGDTYREGSFEFPWIEIIDKPAISERGQWGGNARDEFVWNAQWKLNLIEMSADVSYSDGELTTKLEESFVEDAWSQGVSIVPYIPHLEQVAKLAGLLERDDIAGTPDPTKPLPPEYVPGLCMSNVATHELIEEWLAKLASYPHVESIEVWLSEGASPCFCENCAGVDPFVLEVKAIATAFSRIKAERPESRLRLLLTQGSYPSNDKVIETADADVEIVYYDGGRTYDSSHSPMIYPLLEAYASNGGWLGVYPQITHCWRTVFPFTGPQLIRARAEEFARKGLTNVVGYAVPSNRHHEFSVMALAEWSWNPEGRSPREFAAAYATVNDYPDPEAFAEWAVLAGEAGWWLAESRLLLRLCYDYKFFEHRRDRDDHRFEFAGFQYERETIDRARETATSARDAANATGIWWTVDESEAVAAGLDALIATDEIVDVLSIDNSLDEDRASGALAKLDSAAHRLCTSVSHWGEEISAHMFGRSAYSVPSRLRDTTNVLYRYADALRSSPHFAALPDPGGAIRERRLGTWSRESFREDGLAEFEFDLENHVPRAGGVSYLCLTYTGGSLGGRLEALEVAELLPDDKRTIVAESVDAKPYIGRWETWHDVKITVPELTANRRYILRFVLRAEVGLLSTALAHGDWEFSGTIGIRTAPG